MSLPESLSPADFEYLPRFLAREDADALLACLWRELEWEHRQIRLFGRRAFQPRLVAYYGDPGAVYRYSGLRLEPQAWHASLRDLRQRLESFCHHRFNAVLANAYRDGQDSMGWHSDDERELGPCPAIASLSLGAPRRFLVRPKQGAAPTGRRRSIAMTLEHGSLLLMRGESQRLYQHALPRTRKPCGLRINLTFRHIREAC